MRSRLRRKRFKISAPRVSIRSHQPWRQGWLGLALLASLCVVLLVGAFQWGKSSATLEPAASLEVRHLRMQLERLSQEQQSHIQQTGGQESLRIAEHTAIAQLAERIRQLEADNRSLRDDLGFFEKLIPTTRADKQLDIRGLQADLQADGAQLRWQVLAIQPLRNAPEFKGQLELILAGTQDGKPWATQPPAVSQSVHFQQYRRAQGVLHLPAKTVVKTVTARLVEGGAVRAMQTFTMDLSSIEDPGCLPEKNPRPLKV